MTKITKFWMVYVLNQGYPRRQHTSRRAAVTEAHRLAKQFPGVSFVVLAAVAAFQAERPPEPEVHAVDIEKPAKADTDDSPNDIPF